VLAEDSCTSRGYSACPLFQFAEASKGEFVADTAGIAPPAAAVAVTGSCMVVEAFVVGCFGPGTGSFAVVAAAVGDSG